MYDVDAIRADFPILSREINGKPLIYLDNGASAQKPKVVIDAINTLYINEYSHIYLHPARINAPELRNLDIRGCRYRCLGT